MHADKLQMAAGTAAALLLTLCGCTFFPADVRAERLAYLNAVVDEVDLGSISTVVCDFTFGEPGISSGYYRTQLLEGPEFLDAAFERLRLFDLEPRLVEQRFSASRSDGIALSGMVIPPGLDDPEITERLVANGCDIPASGGITFNFSERGLHTSRSQG